MSKKDRNVGLNPYPVYQNYGMMPNMNYGMMPPMPPMSGGMGMMPGMGMPNGGMNMMPNSGMNVEAQINMINNQLNNLEKRVSHLEGSTNSGVKYNESNYYIV